MSVNRFEGKDQAFMNRGVIDFDSNVGSWRIPYKENLKVMRFCRSKDIDHTEMASGGKGFHHYILFEEEPVTEETNSKLYSIQYALKKYFDLQCVDKPLLGKKGLLIRIPQTLHVAYNKKQDCFVRNGNYCRYIPDDEYEKGLEHIIEMIKEPGEMPPETKPTLTLDDISDLIPDYKYREKGDGSLNLDLNPGEILTPEVYALGLPCLIKIAQQDNPDHHKRLELVAWLKLQNYRDISIVAFIKDKTSWSNYNYQKTVDNVRSIEPRFPKCNFLRGLFGDEMCEKCSWRNR